MLAVLLADQTGVCWAAKDDFANAVDAPEKAWNATDGFACDACTSVSVPRNALTEPIELDGD